MRTICARPVSLGAEHCCFIEQQGSAPSLLALCGMLGGPGLQFCNKLGRFVSERGDSRSIALDLRITVAESPRAPVTNSLENLLQEGVISEILSRLKSGKEADVFIVRQAHKTIAAKVYKDHAQRSFKNNASYREGRSVRNSRSQRAIESGSRFGKEAAEEAWKSAEANTLFKLHAAGVRVPTPVMFLEGVLLMELVLDREGLPAARLIDAHFDPALAMETYKDLRTQMVRMLCCDVIHGDLSPYNILWAGSGATIIDFPQAVYASQNSNAERFFLRDARNVLDHFAGIDPRLRMHSRDGSEIWRAYQRRELTPDFVPSGRPAFDAPRSFMPGRSDASQRPQQNGSRPQHNGFESRHNGSRPQQNGSRPRQNGSRPQQNGSRPQQNGSRPQHNGSERSHQGAPPTHGSQRSERGDRQRQAPRNGQPNAAVPAKNHGRRPVREVVVLHKRPLARDVAVNQAAALLTDARPRSATPEASAERRQEPARSEARGAGPSRKFRG